MNELLSQFGTSLLELITLVVAVSALFFSGWQLFTQKRHNQLSVKPFLTLRHKWQNGARTVSLKNVGLGPAVIYSHKLEHKNKIVRFEFAQHVIELAERYLGLGYYSGGKTIEASQVIDVGESIKILGLNWHEQHNEDQAKETVVSFLEHTDLTVVYKSMYGKKQTLKRRLVSPDDYYI